MSGLPSSSSAPCWVRHPSLLLFRLQPSIFWTVLLLNRNLPRDTPWHTSSMTTAARVNLLLGKVECDSSKKPWGASSPEDFLARLDTIFLPNVVDEVAVWLLKDETATRCDSSSHLAVRPYNKAAFTEQILVTVLHRVEEAHAGAAMRLRLSSITSKAYELPAGLIHRRVPAWVKNPILLCLDCRGVTIKVIKQINTEMPADDDWWRDHMDTPTRVSVITERVKKLFHWHIGQSGEELSATPPLQRKAGIPAADDAAMQTRVTSPYNTASLARWIFRRHVAMVIEDDVMQYDYTVPGISSKERERLSATLWDIIHRTMLDIVRRCEETEQEAGINIDMGHDKDSFSVKDARRSYNPSFYGDYRSPRVEAIYCTPLGDGCSDTGPCVVPPGMTRKPKTHKLPVRIWHTLRSAADNLSNLV